MTKKRVQPRTRLRRICNQASFGRINVHVVADIDTVAVDRGQPFDILFDPALHADALTYDAVAQQGMDAEPADVADLHIQHSVGPTWIEPATLTT
ncbi:hypothetical protein KXS11_06155 [Plantibacter flavus]|uniref:hypothetical protein n=1 Tax=Plantibacter flavus TaxID=150123 RepID=UPI003F13EE4C